MASKSPDRRSERSAIPEPFDALGDDHESTNGVATRSLERFVIDLVTDFPGLLTAGAANVLAIQGLNSTLDDDDFVLSRIGLGGSLLGGLLAGDYNADGMVDAADYSVWRDNVGKPADTLPNDPTGEAIGTAQYNTWRANYSASLCIDPCTAENVAVPEPSAGLLAAVLLVVAASAVKQRGGPIEAWLGCTLSISNGMPLAAKNGWESGTLKATHSEATHR